MLRTLMPNLTRAPAARASTLSARVVALAVGCHFALCFALGCAAPSGDVSAADPGGTFERGALYELPPGAAPLATAPAADWQLAPAGCEGLLPTGVTFEVASGADGILVAVDQRGLVVCADTIEAIRAELLEEGRASEASELDIALRVTLGAVPDPHAPPSFDPSADDPSPQPSCPNPAGGTMELTGPDDGESQPGDPSPQPS